jgi:hypothetical protein
VCSLACERAQLEQAAAEATEPSPNANIMPAPLTSGVDRTGPGRSAGRRGAFGEVVEQDAGSPHPVTLEDNVAPYAPVLGSRETHGIELKARLRWHDLAVAPGGAQPNQDILRAARDDTAHRLTIELNGSGRMRWVLASDAFPLPRGTELRSFVAGYGHLLVFPSGTEYRVLLPGMLKALFSERRADASPVVRPTAKPEEAGTELGHATSRTTLTTPSAELLLEQAPVPAAGSGGQLLCRLLVELTLGSPDTEVCEPMLVPLRADYTWPEGGRLTFEVTALTREQDLYPASFAIPPVGATLRLGELPAQREGSLLEPELVRKLYNAPQGAEANKNQELVVVNHADTMRYVLFDGVPLFAVPPRSERRALGLWPGRYSVSSRDLLVTERALPQLVEVPGRVVFGTPPDAGSASP